eukprot:3713190-Amphidinium_carterae.1
MEVVGMTVAVCISFLELLSRIGLGTALKASAPRSGSLLRGVQRKERFRIDLRNPRPARAPQIPKNES